jgi:hypothetical protein
MDMVALAKTYPIILAPREQTFNFIILLKEKTEKNKGRTKEKKQNRDE